MQDSEGVAGGVLAPAFAAALEALPVIFPPTHVGPASRGGRRLAPTAANGAPAAAPRGAAAAPTPSAGAPPVDPPAATSTDSYWVRLRAVLSTHLRDERLVRAVAADMQRAHMRWVAGLSVDEVEALAGGVMLPRQRA